MRSLLAKFPKLRAVVVGDVMLDEYIWGHAHRLSPEAPVPVVAVERESYVAGGSANVALNLVSFGAKAELCGWIGQDPAGEKLRAKLQESGVTFDPRFARAGTPTILKTRVVADRQQLCRLDREGAPAHYALHGTAGRKWIEEKLDGATAVIFSDYAKGALSPELVRELAAAAQKRGVFVALDPKPRRPLEIEGLDLLTPNWKEALEMAGYSPELPGPAQPDPKTVADKIYQKYHPRFLVMTLGAEGMQLSENGLGNQRIPTYAREVFDVTGAGDTVIAALTLALAAGAELKDAVHFANTAAGVVVGKLGTATATPEEILNYHK
ncbi:MAG TPA: bifunctional ADP-heptose synthase [Opitutales bacterium]|jgi:rfaE bifunctional protein kinase chain/domain|nr:bifunctional ADP-heptose synthase [Opitutales bacterium]